MKSRQDWISLKRRMIIFLTLGVHIVETHRRVKQKQEHISIE